MSLTDAAAAPLFADRALARRLEAIVVSQLKGFAETAAELDPAGGACWTGVADGVAAYSGPGSLVNQALGLGMRGPVADGDIRDVEAFYASRGASGTVCVCPLAHPSLVEALARRGWVPDAFEHVLVTRLAAEHAELAPTPGIEVREVAGDEEREVWAIAAATGFSDPLEPQAEQLALGRIVVRRPGSRLFLAWVGGRLAGTGELHVEDGVAWLSGDATLPAFRRRGVQAALQRHRLRAGAETGCELAVSEAAPGSASQRNMERLGFRVAYTRLDTVLPRIAGRD